VPFKEGQLIVERVVRPQKVEELLALSSPGQKNIVFDLDDSLQRTGLVGFINECNANEEALELSNAGLLQVPEEMKGRFGFYEEFYGLSVEMLLEVELLQSDEETKSSDSSGSSEEDGSSVKKFDEQLKPGKKKKPKKSSQKLKSQEVNVVPAGITYIMENPDAKKSEPKPIKPTPLSSRLGAQKISLNKFSLGKAAASLKSSGISGFGRR